MKKFQSSTQLNEYLKKSHIPQKVKQSMQEAISAIEAINAEYENSSYLIITHTKQGREYVEQEFNLKTCIPEYAETIEAYGDVWLKRVYIFSDAGDGIIYYARAEIKFLDKYPNSDYYIFAIN